MTVALTRREIDVLNGILRGECAKETARRLGTHHYTIKTQRESIYRKLGVKTAIQAIAKVYREHLIPLETAP